MEFFGLIHKRPGYDPFFGENPFSPTDKLVFMGLVVQSCHFDVTACAEARQLAQLDRLDKNLTKSTVGLYLNAYAKFYVGGISSHVLKKICEGGSEIFEIQL